MSIELGNVGGSSPKDFSDDTSRPLLKDKEMKNKTANISQSTLVENGKDSPNNLREEVNAPVDRYNLIMLFFILHGVGTLMPWNAFINANSYFSDYKLTIRYENGTEEPSEYKQFFLSNLGITANIPGVIFNIVNIFAPLKGENYTCRIVGAIIIEICVVIFTIVLAVKDTSDWITGFFYSTIISVIVLNFANGIYQNSIFGLASKFPMKFTNYVILGNNICGTFTAVTNIITLGASPNLRIAAIYYFVSALTVLLVAVDTFLALPINRFYRFHLSGGDHAALIVDNSATEDAKIEKISGEPVRKTVPYGKIFGYCWKQCLNVFLVFFVTLAVFPVIQVNVSPSNPVLFGTEERTKKYFTAVFCFFCFNFSAMLGNIVPNFVTLPGPNKLWIPVVARFVFIPFFLFSNLLPSERTWPVYVDNDYFYLLGCFLFAISSGYLSSLAMMYAPRSAPPEYAGIAAMMAAACLMSGIFLGVTLSPYLMLIVC